MKLLRFCVIGLLPICGVLADEEVIKSQSPDAKFALRLASASGGSAASIVDAKSHAAVLDKNEFGEDVLHVSTEVVNSEGETKLVWSIKRNRKRFGPKRGGAGSSQKSISRARETNVTGLIGRLRLRKPFHARARGTDT
jgi:hypothetical protein